MFDSIDKGEPNTDAALFLFGLLNDARDINISVAPMSDAQPVEGILYCYGEDHVVVSRDGNESIEFDNAVDAIQAACAAALDPSQRIASFKGKANALAIMRDVLADMVPRRPHRLMVGPLTFDDPYAHLADFARFLFNPSRNALDYREEHKKQLIELYKADQAMLKDAISKAKQPGAVEDAENKIRDIFKEHAQVQQFLIKAIREVDNATLSCSLTREKDSMPYNSYYRIVWPLCR
jgi:hypothetical protein